MKLTYLCFLFALCGLAFEFGFCLDPLKIITSRLPKLSARIEKIVPCDEFPITPIQFKNMTINQDGFNQFSLWGNISLSEPFDRPITLESELSQCFGKGDTSTCEYYFKYKKEQICDLLERGDKTWEYFTKYTGFPKKCPFPAEDYFVNGALIDLQSLSYLPVFPSYWHIESKAFKGDKLMFCMVSEVSLKMTMSH